MKLSRENWVKVGKGAILAGLGASAVYLVEALPGFDWGLFAPVATAVIGVLANYVRKLIWG